MDTIATKLIHREQNRMQGSLLRNFVELRRALWAFDRDLAWYASGEGAKLWKELGLEGLAHVCFCISEEAKQMPNGGAVAARASALAWMMAHEA